MSKVIVQGSDAGFFSMFRGTLGTIDALEKDGHTAYVFWKDTLYNDPDKGDNAWEYYFDQLCELDSSGVFLCNSHVIPPREYATRVMMNKLINKHVRVKEDILNEVDALTKDFNDDTLGVHIRLTDKHNCTRFGEPETGKPIEVGIYTKHIDAYLEKHPEARVFLATDDANCLKDLIGIYGTKLIYKDAIRSTGEKSIHHDLKGNNYQKGRDVLVDCLALSRCNHLIKGISNVALAAMFFNMDLTCETLNSIWNNDTREDFVNP